MYGKEKNSLENFKQRENDQFFVVGNSQQPTFFPFSWCESTFDILFNGCHSFTKNINLHSESN